MGTELRHPSGKGGCARNTIKESADGPEVRIILKAVPQCLDGSNPEIVLGKESPHYRHIIEGNPATGFASHRDAWLRFLYHPEHEKETAVFGSQIFLEGILEIEGNPHKYLRTTEYF
jgi:hypothetical protein